MEKKRVPIDDFYWYVEMKQGGPTVRCDTEEGRPVDEWRFQENNYFDTKTKAEIVAKKICEVLNSMCEKQPLFENAKFGDVFKTREGNVAVYHRYDALSDRHILIHEGIHSGIKHRSDGTCSLDYTFPSKGTNPYFKIDIISKWDKK